MEQLGIMLYGYNQEHAAIIKNALESILNDKIIMISGSYKETKRIEDIIADGTFDSFEDKDDKILMFLGFNDEHINATLGGFPRSADITRPIFCGLTENNITWTLTDLLEHLLEEHRYWKEKNR